MKISDIPKVSIITCFLNADKFLEETINSVLQQEYKNWELILVDDGSSDNSAAIATKYIQKYPGKIFIYQHENFQNRGLSASRNLGIEKSTGELITFLDADDVYFPFYLSAQVYAFRSHPAAMVCEATEYWFDWNNKNLENIIIPIGTKQDYLFLPQQLMTELYPLGKGAAPCVCGIIIRKDILIKHGGFDESFKGMYEDQVFLSKIYLNEQVFISSNCYNRYRQRSDSLVGSSNSGGEYFQVRMRFLEWLKDYLDTQKLFYPEVNMLLENALLPLPLVSVVTAFLNEEQFLAEAIESVLTQSYPNWELILVDDGSTDGSTEIALKYSRQYPGQIIFCDHEGHMNKGLSASRNHGIKRSSGSLIAILDADDKWKNGKLTQQVRIFQSSPNVSMVAEASEYWHSWTTSIKKDIVIPVGAPADKVYAPVELMYYLYPLTNNAAPCPSGLMIAKQALDAAGGFEESFTHKHQLYEDQAFLAKIYLKNTIYISSECNNFYRQRPGSIVQWVKSDGHYHVVRERFLIWLEKYLYNQNIKEEKLTALLNKALFPYRHPMLNYLTRSAPEFFLRVLKKIFFKSFGVINRKEIRKN